MAVMAPPREARSPRPASSRRRRTTRWSAATERGRRSPPSRRSPGRTASSRTSVRPTGSRTSSPSGSRAARSRRGSSTATRTCRSPGWRADEFEARLSGVSYRELHGEGGIYRSARMLAEASDDEVLAFCRSLVQEMADHGTTALELKTGYGLSVEAELRQARLARRLAQEAPQTCSVTLLACHAVPEGMRARRLGPNGVRRADPGRGERGPGRRRRRLRGGHRVLGRRPRRGRDGPPRRPDCRSAATPTSWGPRAPPRPRSRSGRGARTT